jgi:hypothetical protein
MQEFDYKGDAKVLGQILKRILEGFGSYVDTFQEDLCKSLGVEKIGYTENDWYELSKFLNTLAEFQKRFGRDFIKNVGKGVFTNAPFPPGIDSVEKGMSMTNEAYYMNHQASPGEVGSYIWTQESDNKGVMFCDNPYPCAFDYGLLEGISQTFSPNAMVFHDNTKPCRQKGGDSCTFIVQW